MLLNTVVEVLETLKRLKHLTWKEMKHVFLSSMDNWNKIIRSLAYHSLAYSVTHSEHKSAESDSLSFYLKLPAASMIFVAGI